MVKVFFVACNETFLMVIILVNICAFFRGVSGGIVVLLSLLASFVASTRLIRPGIGEIDNLDQSRQAFEQ